MPRGNACSRVNWMRQLRRSKSATKARANSIASTGDSLAGPQFAISRPCETAKSWRSLPHDAELQGCHGAACSRLSQTGLRALALIESLRTISTKSAGLILKNPLHVRNPKVAHSVRYGWEAVRWRSKRKERSPKTIPRLPDLEQSKTAR